MFRFTQLFLAIILSSHVLIAQEVVFLPEFEKNEALMLKWNYDQSIDSTIARIASAISENDEVWIVFDPFNSVSSADILTELTNYGSNPENIVFIEGTAENPWLRDYGPVAGYYIDETVQSRHFVDASYNPSTSPQADTLSVQLATDLNFNFETMPLNFEGGNLLLDGIGRGFVSDRVLAANPAISASQVIQTLYTRLSLNEIIVLPSVPECGGGEWSEISRLIKFIDSETVLVAQFPENLPYYQEVEMLADTLSGMYNDVGKQLKVVRIPTSPDANGQFALSDSGTIQSYTSAIIFNNKILIPSFNQSYDSQAFNIYQEVLPGYEIIPIPSQNLASAHGSLYRLAVNIPQEKLFRIRHSKHTGVQPFESEIWINAFLESWEPVDSLQLFYRIHPSQTYEVINTYGCCGGNNAFISGFTVNDTVSYYLKAFTGDFSQTLPLAAPEGQFTFWFDAFTSINQSPAVSPVTVFPNPSQGIVNVNGITKSGPDDSFQLINLIGNIIAEGKFEAGSAIRFPDDLAEGFYVLKIINTGKTHFCKLYLHS